MNKQEFNGKTLDEALSAAARALGTDVSLLSYNILPQSSGGLFSKLFQRGVRLEAWVDSNNDIQAAAREAVRQARADSQDGAKNKQPNAPRARENQPSRDMSQRGPNNNNRKDATSPRPVRAEGQQRRSGPDQQRNASAPNRRPERSQSHQQRSAQANNEIAGEERSSRPRSALNSPESVALLNELAVQFVKGFNPDESSQDIKIDFLSEEEVLVTVQSAALEEFLIRTDRLSCAFEHLFKRIAQKKFGDVSGRVTLNAGSAAAQREEKLKQMALEIAAKVRDTGKTITLGSKSSQERRVIHLALENTQGIATKSIGIGENRKLIVYSTDRPQRDRHHGSRRNGQRPQNRSNAGEVSDGDVTNHDSSDSLQAGQRPDGQPRRQRRRGRRGGNRQNRQGGRAHPNAESSAVGTESQSESLRDSDV
ncbi:MAG: hypothetical protein RLZZ488_1437 [Pseudomonadota bacterium]|jgi:spoIIIJ-associated protein